MVPKIESLSIAAPAYNEAEGIEAIVVGWVEYLRLQPHLKFFEIVICNDGSKDGTAEILSHLSSKFPELKVIHHAANKGAAAALTTAISNTTGAWVLLLDTDGQFPISNFEHFRDALNTHPAYAYLGKRPQKKDSLFARFGSWASGLLCNLCYGTRYQDFNSACKLVEGKVLRSLHLEARGLNYSTDVTAQLIETGYLPVEIPIRHEPRKKGKSSRALIRDAVNRFLFVSYLIDRRMLIRLKVLQNPSETGKRPYG